MPTYRYRAKDRAGNTVTGTVEADNESHAAASIREMGHLPMDIGLVGGPGRLERPVEAGSALARYVLYPLWTGVGIKALAVFYRQLATLLGSGMSISEALRSVRGRTGGRLGRIIAEAEDTVQHGGRFSDVIQRHPRVFGRLQLSLIRVGEGGGMLDTMADRVATYLEYEMSVRRLISKLMLYPVAILVFALAVHICVPHIKLVVDGKSGEFLAAIGPQVRVWLFWGIGIIVAAKLLFQFDAVKLVWDTVKIVPPVIGTTARKIAMSRFCRALALLYSAGMPIVESVSIAAEACGNLAIMRCLKYAIPGLQTGQGLTETLARTGALMPIVLDMLTTGERTGNTDAVLEKVADYMDDEADSSIHKMGIVLFMLMILIAAAVVLVLLVNFYSGLVGGMMKQAE